jgi:predicted metal-dependent hydrolase
VLKPGPGRYLLRTGTMLATTVTFWLIVFDYHVRLMIADRKRGGHLRGVWRVVKYLYGPRRGVFPRIAGEWLSFFRPGFHPWDHDNRAHLALIDGLVAAVDAANALAPSARKAMRRGVRAAA